MRALSAEVGAIPARNPGKAAGRPPEAMLFIDDRQENIQAGDALGLQTHRFRSLAILKDYLTGLGIEVEDPE